MSQSNMRYSFILVPVLVLVLWLAGVGFVGWLLWTVGTAAADWLRRH